MTLAGAGCVVTGAASGIGAAIATAFVAAGARVAGIDRNDVDLRGVDGIRCDLATAEGPAHAMAAARGDLGAIDVLVCAAGISRIAPFTEMSDQDYVDQLAVNLLAPMRCCRAVLPAMRAQKRGRIIIIVSELAEVAQPGYVAYCATKGGLRAFVRALALECAGDGIQINGVSPGPVDTPMLRSEFTRFPDPAAEAAAAEASMPIGRLGRAEEIAAIVTWLASDAPALLHGHLILADGGKTLA